MTNIPSCSRRGRIRCRLCRWNPAGGWTAETRRTCRRTFAVRCVWECSRPFSRRSIRKTVSRQSRVVASSPRPTSLHLSRTAHDVFSTRISTRSVCTSPPRYNCRTSTIAHYLWCTATTWFDWGTIVKVCSKTGRLWVQSNVWIHYEN